MGDNDYQYLIGSDFRTSTVRLNRMHGAKCYKATKTREGKTENKHLYALFELLTDAKVWELLKS